MYHTLFYNGLGRTWIRELVNKPSIDYDMVNLIRPPDEWESVQEATGRAGGRRNRGLDRASHGAPPESVDNVILPRSIPAQICELVHYISNDRE